MTTKLVTMASIKTLEDTEPSATEMASVSLALKACREYKSPPIATNQMVVIIDDKNVNFKTKNWPAEILINPYTLAAPV